MAHVEAGSGLWPRTACTSRGGLWYDGCPPHRVDATDPLCGPSARPPFRHERDHGRRRRWRPRWRGRRSSRKAICSISVKAVSFHMPGRRPSGPSIEAVRRARRHLRAPFLRRDRICLGLEPGLARHEPRSLFSDTSAERLQLLIHPFWWRDRYGTIGAELSGWPPSSACARGHRPRADGADPRRPLAVVRARRSSSTFAACCARHSGQLAKAVFEATCPREADLALSEAGIADAVLHECPARPARSRCHAWP